MDSGVLVLDKHEGPTSHDIVRRVRGIFRVKRVGHAGTLDPLATGVLVVLIGRATRLSQFLVGDTKSYEAQIAWGRATDTADRAGKVVETTDKPLPDQATVENTLRTLVGEMEQLPPMYSAKKVRGRPLYRLARRGIQVEREPATVTIHEMRLLEIQDSAIRIFVSCSKGTYIRTLAELVGRRLGGCAHLSRLRRVVSGEFHLGQAHPLEELQDMADSGPAGREALGDLLIPMGRVLTNLPGLVAEPETAKDICRGISPETHSLTGTPPGPGRRVRLLDRSTRLLAVGSMDETAQKVRLIRVFYGPEFAP